MSLIEAILLGIVQGITEFFPVSSSAHLKLAKHFLNLSDSSPFFDLVCHSGTLLALMIYLRKDIWQVLTSIHMMAMYFVALLPLVPGYFLLKPLREALSEPMYLGYALMATSVLLFTATRVKTHAGNKMKNVLCIGVMQTAALIPGISRSGSTIAAARFCGWEWTQAARFSFLLAVPTILGGQMLELRHGLPTGSLSWACCAGGFITSFAVGLISARFVFWVYEKEIVRPFAWYCLAMGLIAWIVFNG